MSIKRRHAPIDGIAASLVLTAIADLSRFRHYTVPSQQGWVSHI
jgi:hypothetical protein